MIASLRNTSAHPGSAAWPAGIRAAMEQVAIGAGEQRVGESAARFKKGGEPAHQAAPASRRRKADGSAGHVIREHRVAQRRIVERHPCCSPCAPAEWCRVSRTSARSPASCARAHIEIDDTGVGAAASHSAVVVGIVEHKHIGVLKLLLKFSAPRRRHRFQRMRLSAEQPFRMRLADEIDGQARSEIPRPAFASRDARIRRQRRNELTESREVGRRVDDAQSCGPSRFSRPRTAPGGTPDRRTPRRS